ncbi:PREDICTED: uncharacterized protein LOC106316099 [Brassica oleracea var. oleracea]|uniref:uncharacterized protein LOC106316099 n=1 Tax=Brassica oleracea var. oleracea TaxID=109376 RepID=UPI0006A72C61|nr:PREDICTED: uncharacterized protein LOC106316099 [Brassica oleracea var. oleracea]
MGRDWSWLGVGGKKKSTSKPKKDIKATPPSSSPTGDTARATGCMSGVFNIFDLQHLQFPINHHHLHLPKGVDVEETPFSPTRKDGNLNISLGIKIKTKPQARSSSSSSSLAATESYSPSVKTPTLVARLMGLDLVPDNYISSPTPSSCSSSHTIKHRHYSLQRNSVDGGTRSLPETPRISLGRRSVDVNSYKHQRSSLHLIHVEDKENRSPRDYARKIVMQLKENVSRRRRMGTDITNKEQRAREVHEPKKASKVTNVAPKVQDKPRLQTVQKELQGTEQGEKQSKSGKKRKKAENFKSRLVKPPQTMQEKPFARSQATSNNNNALHTIEDKDSSSRNRASSKFPTFQRQSQTHVSPIAKRALVLEDVDVLVAGDFPETATQSELAFEGEGIVTELERGIFEALVAETTTEYYDTWRKNGAV